MKNNLCEDLNFNERLRKHHINSIEKLNLPKWTTQIKCPFCKKELTPYSIRAVSFKMNPRNIGDLCIDFMCEYCSCGDNLYLRNAFSSLDEAVNILNGKTNVDAALFIVEENMYKMQYNNSLEKMLEVENGYQKAECYTFKST